MTTRKNQNNGWTLLFIVSMVMGWGACTSGVDPTIEVTPKNSTLAVGDTLQLTAKNLEVPGLDLDQDITKGVVWRSSDPAFADVGNADGTRGLVTAASVGTTTIKAEFTLIFPGLPPFVLGFSNDVTVTVTAAGATLDSIAVAPDTPPCILTGGGTQSFTATGTRSDASMPDLTATVTWDSSDEAVATIDADGLATAIGFGMTNITAEQDGVTSPAVTLTVDTVQGPLVSIMITPQNQIIASGGDQQFEATGTFTCGPTQTPLAGVTWESSDELVATIHEMTGLADGVGADVTPPAMTQITATVGVDPDDVVGETTLFVGTPPAPPGDPGCVLPPEDCP